jgi:preprotein translocase subunit YajC
MEFLPLLVLALLFWFLIIAPQRRRGRRQAQLWDELTPGQEIVSVGGLHGRIETVGDDHVTVEIAPGTVVRIDKRAVARRVETDPERSGVP